MGVLWPKIVTPADYESKFTPAEREHIRRHELTHIARRDPHHNLLLAAIRVVFWFNPLVHLAAAAVRLDQELACDAALIERRPTLRRQYAEALLKAHFARSGSPLACAFTPWSRHPLELRVAMIARPGLTGHQYMARLLAVSVLTLGVALVVFSLSPNPWAAQAVSRSEPRIVAEVDLTPTFAR
jgi:beta-lactamase regulating signal transducer with metallopeptidase domain